MDQVTKVDNHFMTREFLESQLVANKERIANLESHIQTLTQRSYTESADKNRIIDDMKEWTLNALEEREISETNAEDISNICGFELTNEFELEVTVQYSITVNARDEESAQNAIHDIDFDSVSYGEEVSYLSSSVDRIDI
jgi:hypothetical protein